MQAPAARMNAAAAPAIMPSANHRVRSRTSIVMNPANTARLSTAETTFARSDEPPTPSARAVPPPTTAPAAASAGSEIATPIQNLALFDIPDGGCSYGDGYP